MKSLITTIPFLAFMLAIPLPCLASALGPDSPDLIARAPAPGDVQAKTKPKQWTVTVYPDLNCQGTPSGLNVGLVTADSGCVDLADTDQAIKINATTGGFGVRLYYDDDCKAAGYPGNPGSKPPKLMKDTNCLPLLNQDKLVRKYKFYTGS